MLEKIFKKAEKARVPAGTRIYAIGDVHGCIHELDTLLARIEEDIKASDLAGSALYSAPDQPHPTNKLIFLGDYIDRGPDSRAVLDRLLAIKIQRPDTVFLKGNHEALLLDFLTDPQVTQHWLDWGGEETLESYGINVAGGGSCQDLAADLEAKIPDTHLSFLRALSLTHTQDDYLFVHAGIRPGVKLDDQQEEDLLWIRKRFHKAAAHERPDKVIVHGHQPMKKPLDAGWRIAVDTGACWNGMLSAVVLQGDTRRFIST